MGLGSYAAMFAAATALVLGAAAAGPVPVASACVITAPANVSVSNNVNQAGAVVNYSAPTFTGADCSTLTCSPASGSFFPLGKTMITCSASGDPGSRASFTITVNDTQPPTIGALPNLTGVTEPGQKAVAVTFVSPTATDNAPGVQVSCNRPATSLYLAGVTNVTCTARDSAGNTATRGFTVAVTETPAVEVPPATLAVVPTPPPKVFFAKAQNGRLTYVVSTAATARIDLARCLDRKCSKAKAVTTLTGSALEGANRVKLPTKAGGKPLPAGNYTATVTASAGGGQSAPLVARYRLGPQERN
jgi:hypothetical protein